MSCCEHKSNNTQPIAQGRLHSMKGPEHQRGSKERGEKKPHQDSKIKKDPLEKGAHGMVAKR